MEQTNINDVLEELKKEVPDANLKSYSEEQIREMHRAVYDPCEIEENIEPVQQQNLQPKRRGRGRTRTRITPVNDPSYVLPIFSKFLHWDEAKVVPLRTGVSVKYVDHNYETNLITFSQIRVDGKSLRGNLYLNQVRDEETASFFTEEELKWYRGYLLLPKVSMDYVVDLLDEPRVHRLIELAQEGQKKRLKRSKRLRKG